MLTLLCLVQYKVVKMHFRLSERNEFELFCVYLYTNHMSTILNGKQVMVNAKLNKKVQRIFTRAWVQTDE